MVLLKPSRTTRADVPGRVASAASFYMDISTSWLCGDEAYHHSLQQVGLN